MNYMDESDFCPKCGKHWAYCECISGELKEPIKIAMREPGYYWVKTPDDTWEPAFYSGQYWYVLYNHGYYNDTHFETINETRILNPDEVHDNEQKKEDSPQ